LSFFAFELFLYHEGHEEHEGQEEQGVKKRGRSSQSSTLPVFHPVVFLRVLRALRGESLFSHKETGDMIREKDCRAWSCFRAFLGALW
jgi:hypothetical protein